ncbi:nucleoside diphosphate kinase regulator [Brenneria corticis]|uniref:Nucleoside diphosphate kinase regulator n=1 Tax=Brenneria corticis TaxID=2173106 RepID=A0A2U1TUC0_9GAMM|nr:nucleoside diphosphate kinase regulator [Brenneria sp. CFCC 11842]PWC12989.1 nucleoside diphosphate kinase regulator [Brenneria sp. CFCC 11842]
MTKPKITISDIDAEILDRLLAQPAFASSETAKTLNDELDRAEILPPTDIPAEVVTMNSQIRFLDLNTREEHVRTLVYPSAMKDSKTQLSVMAPLGAALLGLHVGDAMSWKLPNGGETRVQVLELLYQPEAAGEYQR